jgi:hypothetical protein
MRERHGNVESMPDSLARKDGSGPGIGGLEGVM